MKLFGMLRYHVVYQQYDQVVNLRASFPSWNLLNKVGNLAIGRIWTL